MVDDFNELGLVVGFKGFDVVSGGVESVVGGVHGVSPWSVTGLCCCVDLKITQVEKFVKGFLKVFCKKFY